MGPGHTRPTLVRGIPGTVIQVVATNSDSYALTSARRSSLLPTPTRHHFAAVSCTSRTFCVVVTMELADEFANTFRFDGTAWATARATHLRNSSADLSCGSPTMCVLTSEEGDVSEWDGAPWSTSAPLGPVYVSCLSATFCVGVWGNSAEVYDGTTWSVATTIDTNANDGILPSAACAATDFCVATHDYGEAVLHNGVSWTASSQAGPASYPLYSLSCPSLT
ncbi:MAG: hypothetical protein ACLQNG_07320 [Acidimicrobiales bacterium]